MPLLYIPEILRAALSLKFFFSFLIQSYPIGFQYIHFPLKLVGVWFQSPLTKIKQTNRWITTLYDQKYNANLGRIFFICKIHAVLIWHSQQFCEQGKISINTGVSFIHSLESFMREKICIFVKYYNHPATNYILEIIKLRCRGYDCPKVLQMVSGLDI